jgi:nucleotide-binding universal stress UspA family protein
LAADEGVDLIVMGTHGRTGLMRLLMGSVAEAVVRRAPCPVLTLRQPGEAAASPTPMQPGEA